MSNAKVLVLRTHESRVTSRDKVGRHLCLMRWRTTLTKRWTIPLNLFFESCRRSVLNSWVYVSIESLPCYELWAALVSNVFFSFEGILDSEFLWAPCIPSTIWSCFARGAGCVSLSAFLHLLHIDDGLDILKRLGVTCFFSFIRFEQWILRVVVNNTPRPISDDSAAVIERQRIHVSTFCMLYNSVLAFLLI